MRKTPHLSVLFTSAGRRLELLRCFRAAAEDLNVELVVLATDLEPDLSAACREADRAFRVTRSHDPKFAEGVLEICARERVSLIVPTIDHDLLPLSLMRARFAEIGTELAISDPPLIEIARDKLKTAEFFASHGIKGPRTGTADDALRAPSQWPWPLFAKPRHGSAGRSVGVAANAEALANLAQGEPFIVQELLQRPEFTVNMFFDRAGALRCAVPHERLQVRAGEVEKGITRRHPELIATAGAMAEAFPGARGALCFQAMATAGGSFAVTEINARFGGGYPLADHAGAKFAQWLLQEALGEPPSASNDWKEGVLMLRYDAAVFV